MNDEIRLPPHSKHTESSLLASCLVYPESIPEIADLLSPDDFYVSAHRDVYRAILDLDEARKGVDLVTVAERLQDTQRMEAVGGPSFLASLVDRVPAAVNVQHYAQAVKDKSILRQIIARASNAVTAAYEPGADAQAVLGDAVESLYSVDDTKAHGSVRLSECINERLEVYKKRADSRGLLTGISTGLPALDMCLSGFQDTDLIVVGATPGQGKSALGIQFFDRATESGIPTLLFSLEMSKGQLIDRFLSKRSQVNSRAMISGRMDGEKWQAVMKAGHDTYEAPGWIDDTGGLTLQQIRSRSVRARAKHGIRFIIVDYLGIVSRPSTGKEHEEISRVALGLKNIAKELSLPVLALHQVGRKFADRGAGAEPRISDLYGSQGVEANADVIMLLWGADEDVKGTGARVTFERMLRVAKHRNGPTGRIPLYFWPEIQTFGERNEK
ncbi:MAG: replicative DNA helicase [Pseudodesulfovibrio sp.]|nr:replicative DNA helicase [Pseudodesulfovibrio sp.]